MPERRLKNWIQSYLAYTHESESPEEYHTWCALSAIAGAIRRKVFFDMEYFLLRPNLYTVLIGPAGRCKKSTAMRVSRRILAAVPGLNFTTDSTSRERLIQDMSQAYVDGHSCMTAYSSEFASLFSTSGMEMVVFLTDIYDSPDEWAHRTKSGGTNKIKAPYLNLLGASTPDWIAKAMPLDTVGIGLTSRIIFVYQDTPRVRPAFPKLSAAQRDLRDLLVEDLTTMSSLSGEYVFADDGAKEEYEEWYQARVLNPNPTHDPRLNGYYERKPMHLIKLCMVVAASFRDELVITAKDLRLAHSLISNVEEKMTKVFANVGKNILSTDYDDVAEALKASDTGLRYGELINRFKHSLRKDELLEVLETLVHGGRAILTPGGAYTRGPNE